MRSIYRILDANANRAREGLRVVEEIARFILEDRSLTSRIKKLRGDLTNAMLAAGNAIKARKVKTDVGRKLYTRTEGKRAHLGDVFYSNIKRVEEAVRVLEEFSKLIDPNSGKRFKAIRMKVYQVEKRVALKLKRAGL